MTGEPHRPKVLDLFCGAGGASMGLWRAGFDVTGIDIVSMPNYPFEFHRADALEYVAEHGHKFDAFWAGPPCQRYSKMSNCRPGLAATYPDLVGPTRDALDVLGLPYVIENVVGSTVRPDVTLCGFMFGRDLYRHRVFESNRMLWEPRHVPHTMPASKAGHWRPGTVMSVSGHFAPVAHARKIMEIDWTNREELAESIPPYYAEFIGRQIIEQTR
jgi:DNA (cytosine-5)-methyltransferase 1